MTIKPTELLNQLPTASELLEKPPIRALVDRWNRSIVAGGVRSFLDEMRSELRRRAGDMPLPSIRELAERAAQYIVAQQHISLGTVINATGQLRGEQWSSWPLADAALERMVAVGREFVLEPSQSAESRPLDCEPQLCRLTGAPAAVVVHSYSGALWLALSTIAAGREILVARAEVGEVEFAESLPKLVDAANVKLCEAGTINRASAADYEAIASPSAAGLLRITSDAYRVVGQTTMAELEELVALCRDRDLVLIDALGAASLTDPPETVRCPLRSAQASLAAAVHLVLVRGDGLVGGPTCGILLGDRELVRRIKEHPLFAAWRLDALRAAALAATLEHHDKTQARFEELPTWQLLSATVENLRSRAERMAPQLARVEGIALSTAIETRSPLFPVLTEGCPSYGVALTVTDGNIRSLELRLRSAPIPILGRIDGDSLVLDLRTVMPWQDKTLVDSLLGPSATAPGA